jgi:hypothetical protein
MSAELICADWIVIRLIWTKGGGDQMNGRRILIAVLSIVLVAAALSGVVNTVESHPMPAQRAELANVRDYAAAQLPGGTNYAVDGGVLFKGQQDDWIQVAAPRDVVVSAVAIDSANPNTLFIGAANEMAIFRSTDGGADWLGIPLTADYIGGVTDIALDSAQRLVYVGTDTAGLFRLRDVGSSVILGGQLLLDEPVLEVVAGNSGTGMAFARTEWNLYRAENYGLSWVTVENLHSVPTALAIANTRPATVYVGTMDRGLLMSHDGQSWTTANNGLGLVPGSRLQVNALATDPARPDVLYVATSYLYGISEVHVAPVGISISTDGAQAWSALDNTAGPAIANLLPVTGATDAILALTTDSRAPLALGETPDGAEATTTPATAVASGSPVVAPGILSWLVALLAAMALLFAVASDLRSRQTKPVGALVSSAGG